VGRDVSPDSKKANPFIIEGSEIMVPRLNNSNIFESTTIVFSGKIDFISEGGKTPSL